MSDWIIKRFGEVTSTQDIVRNLAQAGAAEKTLVVAASQTAGRGRAGHSWETCEGNLFFSFLLHPAQGIEKAGQYSFLVAVALHRALSRVLPGNVEVNNKWPNDVLVSGRKVAGILLEIEGDFLIVGVGVNLLKSPPGRISLAEAGVTAPDAASFLSLLLECLDDVLAIYETEGFTPLRKEWLAKALRLGEEIEARLPQRTIKGLFIGIDAVGALQLRLETGEIIVIHSGEIFFGQD